MESGVTSVRAKLESTEPRAADSVSESGQPGPETRDETVETWPASGTLTGLTRIVTSLSL
jgi:hypothetical protein